MREKKSHLFVFLCVILLCFVCVAIWSENKNNEAERNSKYVLSEYEGRIALFENGDEIPKEIYDVMVSALPQEDAERIIQGIIVENESDLQSLIEDYCS